MTIENQPSGSKLPWYKNKKIVVPVAVFVVLTAVGAASSNSSSNSNSSGSSSSGGSSSSSANSNNGGSSGDNGSDSRIKVALVGTSDKAFTNLGGGMQYNVWGIMVQAENITHAPITLNGSSYVVDSQGNTYTGTQDDGAGICARAFTDWSATLNPKAGVTINACYEVPDGTKLVKFGAKDSDTGAQMFTIPLNQTVNSNSQ